MTAPPDSGLAVTPTAGLDHAALDRLSARIRTDVDRGRYLGASVLVARGGLVGHRDTIGDVAPGRPADDDDVYLLMSISKSFTATLVLRAIDQGRFTLDTRVAELLPEFAAGGKQRVTIRQLLTHTAGTYAGFAPPPPLTLMNDMGDLPRNVAAVAGLPAAYTPGARVVYNPFASYAVLGQILVATDPAGRSFQAITHEDLFAPLGMAATSYGLRTDHPRRVPVSAPESHTARAAMVALNSAIDERTEHPAGGAFGTADDLFRFAEMWRRRGEDGTHRVLSPPSSSTRRRTTPASCATSSGTPTARPATSPPTPRTSR